MDSPYKWPVILKAFEYLKSNMSPSHAALSNFDECLAIASFGLQLYKSIKPNDEIILNHTISCIYDVTEQTIKHYTMRYLS